MIETRSYRRNMFVKNVFCKIGDESEQREVINMSCGGLLLERKPSDEDKPIGDIFPMEITFENKEKIEVEGKILRKQERSIAIMFTKITEEQKKHF